MLHPYQEALKIQNPLPAFLPKRSTGQNLLYLLCEVNSWLEGEEFPSVHGSSQGKIVYVLYRNVAFSIDDFWNECSLTMACINKIWPICAFGTAPNQETVRLSAEISDGKLSLIQRSISGKSTDVLETLCFQIDCNDNAIAEKLVRILNAMNWQTNIAAVSWQDVDFLHEQNLILEPKFRSQFCYVGVDLQGTPGDYLLSLDFGQKVLLWTTFLRDGFEPVEFEWLSDEIAEKTLINRMEWELALHEAMDRLGFRIVNQEKSFELFDSFGRRLYFGADCRRAAEWALLKILFPLNYE